MFYSHSRRKLSVLHHSSCLISPAKNHILHFPLKLFSSPPPAPCFTAVLSMALFSPPYRSSSPILFPVFLPLCENLPSSLRDHHSNTAVTEGNTWQNPFRSQESLSFALTRLWWHSPVSLVFLPTLFLLLSVSGWGAAKPIDGEKGDICMSWLQNEPQIAAKFRLFTHHCVTLHCTSEGSLLAKVSSSNSWEESPPPPHTMFLCPLLPPCTLLVYSFALKLLFLPFQSQLTPTLSQENEK